MNPLILNFVTLLLMKFELPERLNLAVNDESEDGVIIIKNLNYSYISGTKVLTDINLNIKKGSLVTIVGPNGAGKTTLLNLIIKSYKNI